MHLSALNTVLIAVGLVVMIVRQFLWRPANPAQLLRFPLLLSGAGLVWLMLDHGGALSALVLAFVLLEALLVTGTGAVMGLLTQFRVRDGLLSMRLLPVGLLLWLVFLAVRVGSFLLADHLGAQVLQHQGALLLCFGLNRLASSAVIQARLTRRGSASPA